MNKEYVRLLVKGADGGVQIDCRTKPHALSLRGQLYGLRSQLAHLAETQKQLALAYLVNTPTLYVEGKYLTIHPPQAEDFFVERMVIPSQRKIRTF